MGWAIVANKVENVFIQPSMGWAMVANEIPEVFFQSGATF